MTKQSTALLAVSPKSIAPWGDTAWRISLTAQLVEGGSASYWLATPTQPAQHRVSPAAVTIEVPNSEEFVNTTLIVLALHLGGHDIERYLLETGNITLEDNVRTLAPYWDLSDEGRLFLAKLLSAELRLGITILDEPTMLMGDVTSGLLDLGFDLDVFMSIRPVELCGAGE